MHNKLVSADYIVFIIYFFVVAGYGYWVYQRKRKKVTDTHDFLAEGSLTWWAIGASLIASNISAEASYKQERKWFLRRDCRCSLRMDRSVGFDHCRSLVYAGISEK